MFKTKNVYIIKDDENNDTISFSLLLQILVIASSRNLN